MGYSFEFLHMALNAREDEEHFGVLVFKSIVFFLLVIDWPVTYKALLAFLTE